MQNEPARSAKTTTPQKKNCPIEAASGRIPLRLPIASRSVPAAYDPHAFTSAPDHVPQKTHMEAKSGDADVQRCLTMIAMRFSMSKGSAGLAEYNGNRIAQIQMPETISVSF